MTDKFKKAQSFDAFAPFLLWWEILEKNVKAHIVTGFIEAGKTTYIQSLITNDFFHKREAGKTLILAFESGQVDYDEELLSEYKTKVVFREDEDIREFINEGIKDHDPDRIFIEYNAMTEGLWEVLTGMLDIAGITMLIDHSTLNLYYRNMPQKMRDMIAVADPVIINRAKEKEALDIYATPFRIMNTKALFLWESPMGYHEKIFGNPLPFDPSVSEIVLSDKDFPAWYVDALEFPGNYEGKIIDAHLQIKERPDRDGFMAGRMVMTCCMNDISFLGVEINAKDMKIQNDMFVHLKAKARVKEEGAGKRLVLDVIDMEAEPYPKDIVLSVLR